MILNLYNSKDASAAAIYGSRAANGNVITTKKGTKGRVKVSFSSQVGVNTVANTVDVLRYFGL
jgi:iron complex outermembrane receptor protein